MSDATSPSIEPDITARAGTYYRRARYLIVAACILLGAYFMYDGFVGYPNQNANAFKLDPNAKQPQSDLDIVIQKVLGIVLPIVGVAYLVWTLRNSRGEVRLSGSVLHAPGHPPIPIDAITQIDKQKWDLKGVAFLHYELSSGTKGRLRLDDFVYERKPIDEIYKRIEETLLPPGEIDPKVSAEQG